VFNPREISAGSYAELSKIYGNKLKPPVPLKYVQDATNFDRCISAKQPVSVYGPNIGYRFPAGHIKPLELWYLIPYVRDLLRSAKYQS
jgi:hypothetical protein